MAIWIHDSSSIVRLLVQQCKELVMQLIILMTALLEWIIPLMGLYNDKYNDERVYKYNPMDTWSIWLHLYTLSVYLTNIYGTVF